MLGVQFCIGAVNDLVDETLDARTKPWKPIPSGTVTRKQALLVAILAGGGGLVLAATRGIPVLLLAMGMLTAGLAYDFVLKRTAWSWVAYALALPLLPVYAWWGAAGVLPPRAELIVPVAALAGPGLQLTNGLVDAERDRLGGVVGLVAILGRARALVLVTMIIVVIHAVAWSMLLTQEVPLVARALGVGSTVLACVALTLSTSVLETRRERGWRLQTVSMGLLAVAWLAAAAVAP